MTNKELLSRLKTYEGENVYLNTLKSVVEKGEELSFTQILLGKKMIMTHAIKTDDKTILVEKVKEFKIDWTKYNIRPPFPFQRVGINWLLNKERALLGDQMGLGKSLQSIIAALELKAEKILIVCPNSLKLNWAKEIIPFDKDVSVIHKDWTPKKFTIINYEGLKKHFDKIIKHKFELVIADEAHNCKNMKAQKSKCFSKIATKSKRVWLLTGTPIANKPIDFYNLLKICKHDLGKNKQDYGSRYCGGQLTHWGYDYNGASNLKELHFKTQDIIFRRTKDEVLDLPDKTQIPIYLEFDPTQRKLYETAVQRYYEEKYKEELAGGTLGEDFKGEAFVELAVYRKFTAIQKVEDGSTIELINNVLDQGEKVVVFTNYLGVIDKLAEHFKEDCLTLDGRVDVQERQKRIDLFQSGKGPKIMLCNLAVGSVGVTLTKATTAIMNDLSWSPAVMQQAEDRIYRIGQDKKVNILYPIYSDTIDQLMFDVIKEKVKNINDAVEGKEIEGFNGSVEKEILDRLNKLKSVI